MPGLGIKEEYNDNVFLTATGAKKSDFITTLTPALDFSSATERGNFTLSGGVNQLVYARQRSLDATDFFARSGFTWRLEPRLAISAGTSYLRDSRPDRIDQDSGLALAIGSDRQNYQLSAVYALSEKSNTTLSYAYAQEIFDDSVRLNTRVHSATLSQDYDLDSYLRQTKFVGTLGYVRSLTDISLVDYYMSTVGLTGKIHELWSFSVNAGGDFIHSKFDEQTVTFPFQVVNSTVSSDSWGWVGNVSLNYNGEKLSGGLTFTHDVTTASGRAGATERTGVSAGLKERFTHELSGNLSLGYSLNKTAQNQFSSQAIDETRLYVGCGLHYDFSDRVALEGSYRFTNIDYDYGASPSQARQNAFMLRLTMSLDLLDL